MLTAKREVLHNSLFTGWAYGQTPRELENLTLASISCLEQAQLCSLQTWVLEFGADDFTKGCPGGSSKASISWSEEVWKQSSRILVAVPPETPGHNAQGKELVSCDM